MPWQKGQSGNPQGRKPNGHTAKDFFCALGGPNGEAYAKQLHQIATGQHDDAQARLKALAIIAPYVWGKPVETVALDAHVSSQTTVVHQHE